MGKLLVAFTSVVALCVGSLPAVASAATAGTSGTVVLRAFGSNGGHLSWASFRRLQENGKGTAGDNDVLLDPATLRVVQMWPLYAGSTGDPTFDWPGRVVSLGLAWPTSDGYSNLIVDIKAPGTYDLNLLAAQQAVAALDAAGAARPGFTPDAAFTTASQQAHTQLSAAQTTPEPAGARALDAAVKATMLLLAESGSQAVTRHTRPAPGFGVTFDYIDGGATDLAGVRTLAGTNPNTWVRIVFDASNGPSVYWAEIAAAHRAGLKVLGQILDSSDMAGISQTAWNARVASYVTALPSVDEWEVGNEVNGEWLGTGVAAKVAFAAAYVKAHSKARTLVTLYWQLGESDAAHSMFTWASANISAATLASVDDLGLSLYPEDHPMGGALDRVLATMHATWPSKPIWITELGYWSAGLGHTWWWGSSSDPLGVGRSAVARLYGNAVSAYAYTGGGSFWWCYLEEAQAGNPLWSTLATIARG